MNFKSIKYFFYFILTQSNEIEYEFKISKFILSIFSLLLSIIFSILAFFFLESFDIRKGLKIFLLIYLVLGAFCSMPCEKITLDKKTDPSEALLLPFASYRLIPVAPIYLFRYCLKISKKDEL